MKGVIPSKHYPLTYHIVSNLQNTEVVVIASSKVGLICDQNIKPQEDPKLFRAKKSQDLEEILEASTMGDLEEIHEELHTEV